MRPFLRCLLLIWTRYAIGHEVITWYQCDWRLLSFFSSMNNWVFHVRSGYSIILSKLTNHYFLAEIWSLCSNWPGTCNKIGREKGNDGQDKIFKNCTAQYPRSVSVPILVLLSPWRRSVVGRNWSVTNLSLVLHLSLFGSMHKWIFE